MTKGTWHIKKISSIGSLSGLDKHYQNHIEDIGDIILSFFFFFFKGKNMMGSFMSSITVIVCSLSFGTEFLCSGCVTPPQFFQF